MENKKVEYTAYIGRDLSILTSRQREAFEMLLSGKKYSEIATKMGCSKQNIYGLIKVARKRLDSPPPVPSPTPRKKPDPKKRGRTTKNLKYADYDFSHLTEIQRFCMESHIAGKTYRQIAETLGITPPYVSNILYDARCKLDNVPNERLRRNAEHQKKYRAKLDPVKKEKFYNAHKKYYQKNRDKMIERFKEYNKSYYAMNRERILARQKERRLMNKRKELLDTMQDAFMHAMCEGGTELTVYYNKKTGKSRVARDRNLFYPGEIDVVTYSPDSRFPYTAEEIEEFGGTEEEVLQDDWDNEFLEEAWNILNMLQIID